MDIRSVRTEIFAGITTFLTMSYIIFVNPTILHDAGMNAGAVFVATCLVCALGSILMGSLTNYPIAIGPGMALNAYFTYTVVQKLGLTWQAALGAVFLAGLIFLVIAITPARRKIIESLPKSLSIGTGVGIGLFIIIIAGRNVNITALFSYPILFFILGILLIIVLDYFRIMGAIFISILLMSFVGILFGINQYHGIFALPPSIQPTFLQLDLKSVLNPAGFSIIFALFLITFFDCTGTLLGILQQPLFNKDANRVKRISRALLADSITTISGSLLGTSATSAFIESASGIRAGGRYGITSITVGILFLFALFLSPLAATIPTFAVASALFYVGVLMIKNINLLEFDEYSEFIPGIITAIMIPLTFSVADGFGAGILSYIYLKLFTRKFTAMNPTLIILGIIFIGYFIIRP